MKDLLKIELLDLWTAYGDMASARMRLITKTIAVIIAPIFFSIVISVTVLVFLAYIVVLPVRLAHGFFGKKEYRE
jgi:pilus assembly protein TadC